MHGTIFPFLQVLVYTLAATSLLPSLRRHERAENTSVCIPTDSDSTSDSSYAQ